MFSHGRQTVALATPSSAERWATVCDLMELPRLGFANKSWIHLFVRVNVLPGLSSRQPSIPLLPPYEEVVCQASSFRMGMRMVK